MDSNCLLHGFSFGAELVFNYFWPCLPGDTQLGCQSFCKFIATVQRNIFLIDNGGSPCLKVCTCLNYYWQI